MTSAANNPVQSLLLPRDRNEGVRFDQDEKKNERNTNSRVEGTSVTRIRPERGDGTIKHGRKKVAYV